MSAPIQLNYLGFKEKMTSISKSTAAKVTFIWISWLICGAAFYAQKASLGWGYPAENTDDVIWFSIFYVLMGASAVAAALGYFAQAMILKDKNWFETELKRKEYEAAMTAPNDIGNLCYKSALWFDWHKNKFIPVAAWVGWLIWGAVWAREEAGWSVAQTLYFAVSSLSTGGLWGLPTDSDEDAYLITAIFAMFGVPLAAFAMAEVGSAMVSGSHDNDTMKVISEPVTVSELRMMTRFGLENGDGNVDKAEFIVLCMVRLGAADPSLISTISDRFVALDHSKDGTLSYKEICGHRDSAVVDSHLQAYIDEIRDQDRRDHPGRRSSRVLEETTAPYAPDDGMQLTDIDATLKSSNHDLIFP